MTTLPRLSGREVVAALAGAGYEKDRQTEAPHRRLVVPDHREIAKGTLRAIIRQAGLTVEEFTDLLR